MSAPEVATPDLDDSTIRGAGPRYPRISIGAIADPRSVRHWHHLVAQSLRAADEGGATAPLEPRAFSPPDAPVFAWRLMSSDHRLVAVSARAFVAPGLARRDAGHVVDHASRLVVMRVVLASGAFGWQIRLDHEPVLVGARSYPREPGRDRSLQMAMTALGLGSRLFGEPPIAHH
jgi:hypothetical protein